MLDDLGAEHRTPWANKKLFQLLNHRYNAMLPTVITSNRMALEGRDHRIVSRLHDWELVRQILMDEAQEYRVGQSGKQALGEREHSKGSLLRQAGGAKMQKAGKQRRVVDR
ncbi:DNA replication protein DnaC [Thermosporothrix hazakensis]|uniref:DNA replication protein DnaC n=1 Tax=Thermosporothrix hazakensis TaxID=644383 RepID=A0A326U5H3_THEHA|nr:hypothetical protein [Thermosporothrix hazakensis]PZW25272.1 DNA replication protein DnaC [Thermosporothrix hazakensis]GCE50504.1 hypothetical protein KTH_53730 [Thermosporothrix hazakensis]